MRTAWVLSRKYTYMISVPSRIARCTVSLVFSRSANRCGRATSDTFMRRRTRVPRRNSARPSRYLPVARSCSSRFSETSVEASRCAVLLATPSRFANVEMPISTSSSEKALSSSIAVATDDSRRRSPSFALAGLVSIGSPGGRTAAWRRYHDKCGLAPQECKRKAADERGAQHRGGGRRAGRRHGGDRRQEAGPGRQRGAAHRRGLRALRE